MVFVYDKDKNWIGILQNMISLQWQENYQSPGEVKIIAAPNEENRLLLQDGHRLLHKETGDVAKIVEVVFATGLDKDYMTVRAKGCMSLLEDRVHMGSIYVKNIEAGIYQMYRQNRRGLALEVADSKGYTEEKDTDFSWGSVLFAAEELLKGSTLGCKAVFDPVTKTETLTVYMGTDRTQQNTNEYVGHLGEDNGVITNAEIYMGSPEYKNYAVVVGENVNNIRTVVTVNVMSAGDERKEIYVDKADLRREYREATQTGTSAQGEPIYTYTDKTYTESQYIELLRAEGYRTLAQHNKEISMTCDVQQKNLLVNKDYFLGDRIPVKVSKYGIMATARVDVVRYVYEETGQNIQITLSDFSFDI